MARHCPRSAEEMYVNGSGTASHLWVLGTHEQKEKWLRPICAWKMTCAIAMTEPDAGSAATGLKTAAGDAYENKELDPLQVSMAKVFVAKTCTKICDTAV